MDKVKKHKSKILIITAVLLLMLLTGGMFWLFNSGHLQYSKSGSQPTVVCDADFVDRYNEAMYYTIRKGSTEPSLDDQGIKDLVTDIKNMANYKTDPTCQTIIFWVAVQSDDYKTASSAYNVLITLHKQRIFSDSNLRDGQPLFMYKEVLKGLTGSGSSEASSAGQ